MTKTIEITKIVAVDDTIKYEIHDHTGLYLLKNEKIEAWVKFYNAESFGFSPESLPESILALPVTLYLIPVTWFYGVELVVPSMDKTLCDNLPIIYATYSKIYGPFKEEWCGKVTAKTVVENKMPKSRFDNIVFFSGGVDAVHAGINNPGKRNVLVSVPSIEYMEKTKEENSGRDFINAKIQLIREFSAVSESDWLLITNNFVVDVFDDERIQRDLKDSFLLNSEAFFFDGWFGIKYLGNLLSAAPFAYAMGISNLILGSSFEQLEDNFYSNLDGSNPELSDSIKFAGISFGKQDGLYTRRSQKVKNIVEWCNTCGKRTKIRTCFSDSTEQCCVCTKCVRTQLNIICAGENPIHWGFGNFDEKNFSRLIRSYHYRERNLCWLWDIVASIDDSRTYPCCDKLLHWLKKVGYKGYSRRIRFVINLMRILKLHRYPYYMNSVFRKITGK